MTRARQDFEAWNKDDWTETFGVERPTNIAENWPADARIAVLLTFDTQGDLDAAVPGYQGTTRWDADNINYCDLTQRQYGVRQGTQRILRILDKYGIKATFPTSGVTAEWYPDLIRDVAARGHEVATHAYRHIPLYELTPDDERTEIELATSAIESVVGRRPVGWRSPMYTTTTRTLDILMDLGYEYNTDFHNDDMPYFLEKNGRRILEIPAGLDDWELYLIGGGASLVGMGGVPYQTPAGVTDILWSEFMMLYDEAPEMGPRMMQYCMHPKISGRPYRARGLEEFIRRMRTLPGVWFTTMEEMARLCR